jgi:hypothetical protein
MLELINELDTYPNVFEFGYVEDNKFIFKCMKLNSKHHRHQYIKYLDMGEYAVYDYKKTNYQIVEDKKEEFETRCGYSDEIMYFNKKISLKFTGKYLSDVTGKFCIMFNHLYCPTKKYIFDCEIEQIIKCVKCVSSDKKHYYNEDLKSICSLSGDIVLENVENLFGSCDDIRFQFLYDEISKIMVIQNTEKHIQTYSHWNRYLSHIYLNRSLHESIIISLMCNNRNNRSRLHIPKYVLLYIFDLF